jgi:tetratricopeptide (TPR) repeat protein
MDQLPTYAELMAGPGIARLSDDEALQRIGLLIDAADDALAEDGLTQALAWCDELDRRPLDDNTKMTLAYFRSNAWAAHYRRDIAGKKSSWRWEQPLMAEQIFWLRTVITNPAFDQWNVVRKCQVFTNLGNCLSNVGRFVESLEFYSRALAMIPNFWEAIGNRGSVYLDYGKLDYDQGHSLGLFVAAHDDLKRSISVGQQLPGGNDGGLTFFNNRLQKLTAGVNIEAARRSFDLDGHSLGRSDAEKRYRKWVSNNCLFLNTLNDIGAHSIATIDVLSLPDFATKIDEPPSALGFFNQLKQEFASARFLFFESIQDTPLHYSDRKVSLVNTLDYPAYGLGSEKSKIAFRMAYSLLDKIAYFLFHYMNLPMQPRQVSFRSIWRESNKKDAPIRKEFDDSENLPFRGLYWLSKDILNEDFQDTTEPDARELYEIRNHLEHKYLKTHSEMLGVIRTSEDAVQRTDNWAHSIYEGDLVAKTLRLLKLTRAAMIYLSLGMHREEQRRQVNQSGVKRAAMHVDGWKDEWKR